MKEEGRIKEKNRTEGSFQSVESYVGAEVIEFYTLHVVRLLCPRYDACVYCYVQSLAHPKQDDA